MPQERTLDEWLRHPLIAIFIHPQVKEYMRKVKRKSLSTAELRYFLTKDIPRDESTKQRLAEYWDKELDYGARKWYKTYKSRYHLGEDLKKCCDRGVLKKTRRGYYALPKRLSNRISPVPHYVDKLWSFPPCRISSFPLSVVYGIDYEGLGGEEKSAMEEKIRQLESIAFDIWKIKVRQTIKELGTLVEDLLPKKLHSHPFVDAICRPIILFMAYSQSVISLSHQMKDDSDIASFWPEFLRYLSKDKKLVEEYKKGGIKLLEYLHLIFGDEDLKAEVTDDTLKEVYETLVGREDIIRALTRALVEHRAMFLPDLMILQDFSQPGNIDQVVPNLEALGLDLWIDGEDLDDEKLRFSKWLFSKAYENIYDQIDDIPDEDFSKKLRGYLKMGLVSGFAPFSLLALGLLHEEERENFLQQIFAICRYGFEGTAENRIGEE